MQPETAFSDKVDPIKITEDPGTADFSSTLLSSDGATTLTLRAAANAGASPKESEGCMAALCTRHKGPCAALATCSAAAATSDSSLKSTSTLRTPSNVQIVLDRFHTSHPALNILAAVALPMPLDAPVMTAVPDKAGALENRTPALRRLVANCPGDPDTVTLTSTHPWNMAVSSKACAYRAANSPARHSSEVLGIGKTRTSAWGNVWTCPLNSATTEFPSLRSFMKGDCPGSSTFSSHSLHRSRATDLAVL
mmetsp:Transcript_49368/g.107773  ORF Transcript_49368/g.107773 Transcript_49368/m.107773 type:complete len:251 (+) Transcript_49368:379-1131(+)